MTIDHSLFQHNTAVSSASASELLDSVCLHSVRVWVMKLMRGCGCVRARARVCLGLASRTAQRVGHRDAPLCLSVRVCARAVPVCGSLC